jgi:hypothetical protein
MRSACGTRSRAGSDPLDLRVHRRIAIDLRGRSLQDFRVHAFCESQHIDRPVHAGLGRLHRVVLVVNRRSRTCQVVNFIDFDVQRERHVVAHQLEIRSIDELRNVVLGASEKIIDTKDVVTRKPASMAGYQRLDVDRRMHGDIHWFRGCEGASTKDRYSAPRGRGRVLRLARWACSGNSPTFPTARDTRPADCEPGDTFGSSGRL